MNSFALDVLNPLVRGTDLERERGRATPLCEILDGKVDGVLIASFLTALTAKGETADEMMGFIDAMIESAVTFSISPDAIDIVGTGGDQLHSVNVSTMAAFAVAGCGVAVAKHGNRSASSSVGSADLLEALGVRIDAPRRRACARMRRGGGRRVPCSAPRLPPGARPSRADSTGACVFAPSSTCSVPSPTPHSWPARPGRRRSADSCSTRWREVIEASVAFAQPSS